MGRPLITILGPSGAGKTVQAQRLAQHRGWEHVSSGALARAAADPAMESLMRQGRLVPPDYLNRLLGNKLASLTAARGVVLDGYPRMLEQATWLETHLEQFNLNLQAVVYLSISREESMRRIMPRGRLDDTTQSLEQRWQYFTTTVAAVIDHYRQQGLLVEVDGHGSMDEVTNRIAAAL